MKGIGREKRKGNGKGKWIKRWGRGREGNFFFKCCGIKLTIYFVNTRKDTNIFRYYVHSWFKKCIK